MNSHSAAPPALDTAAVTRLLDRYVRALVLQDHGAALACLSPAFTQQQGRNASDFVSYEIAEFSPRIEPYFLAEGTRVEIDRFEASSGLLYYSVYNRRGQIIYEEQNRLGDDGLLIGNGLQWEYISKLKFSRTADARLLVRRGLCLRHAALKASAVIFYSHAVEDLRLNPSSFDPYSTIVDFSLPEDDGAELLVDMMVTAGTPGSRERSKVLMRGTDHPHFRANLFTGIDGNRVRLAGYDFIYWVLNVRLSNGESVKIYHPDKKQYTFDHDVVFAVLTDAIDNDWETTTSNQ